MKKKITLLLALPLVLSLSACSDSTSSTQDGANEEATTQPVVDEAMVVPGYKLGEIPAIPTPQIKGLGLIESPTAKVTLDMTESLQSVPGITVTPVRVENGSVTTGDATMQLGENGNGQYSNGDTVVQTDGDGSGQYSDGNITIQRDADGSGQYIDDLHGITLQVDADGSGQFGDDPNEIVLQVESDGSGQYSSPAYSIQTDSASTIYQTDHELIRLNGDGSGEYTNDKTDLHIENDGKGKATVTLGDKEVTVDADPLPKWTKLPLLQMVPAVPTIEANTLKITVDSGVLFDVDKYDIRPDAQKVLNDLAKILIEADVSSFTIEGHTDWDNTEEHNQTLSENRANSVKDYLEKQGVSASITTEGYGESRPVATNETAEGKQQNRRVEFLIPVQ